MFDYYSWSLDPGALVIVREVETAIAGVVYLTVYQSHIMVEMLARNKLLNYPGVGANLLRVIERSVAQQLSIHEIRIEALSGLVNYYDNTLNYEECGSKYWDKEWGELTPKLKRLP